MSYETKTKIVFLIFIILCIGSFFIITWIWENAPGHSTNKPDNKKYLIEIDSLNNLIRELRKEKELMLKSIIKSDSIISSTNEKIVNHKSKINENAASIINISSDSTINIFTNEITGDRYKRK